MSPADDSYNIIANHFIMEETQFLLADETENQILFMEILV